MSQKRIIPLDKGSLVRRGSDIVVMPALENVLADSLFIIEADLAKYRAKVKAGQSLDQSEARIVQGHLKCLVEVAKIQRDIDKENDLSKLSPEQLLELATSLVQKQAEPEHK